MTMFVIQSALLLAIALIIGCAIGYALRMLLAPPTGSTRSSQAGGTGGKVASVPPREAMAGAPLPPPTQVLEKSTASKPAPSKAGGSKSAKSKAAGGGTRKAGSSTAAKPAATARKTRAATGKKTAGKTTAAKKTDAAASSGGSVAPKAAKRPKSVAKPANPDDLTRISGIGPKIAGQLQELGVYRWSQIGAWKKAERDWVNAHLSFKGRIEREDWVKQAKALVRSKGKK